MTGAAPSGAAPSGAALSGAAPRGVALTEHGPAVSVALDDVVGRAVTAARIADAAPDPERRGYWRLKAAGKVGVVAVGRAGEETVTIRIAPKIPVARLVFLLGYARDPAGWRDEDVTVDDDTDLLPALARLFERQARAALRQGPLQGYHVREETSLVVRGRIREADQIRRQHGRMLPVELVHDDYSIDIPENQLLRAACDRLSRLPGGVSAEVRGGLQRLRARLADVTVPPRGGELPRWRPDRLNARYHRALRLADLVLRSASVEHRAGDVVVSGYLFDMAAVFEDFTVTALRAALAGGGARVVRQPTHHLDEDAAIRIVPDLVVYGRDGAPCAVADAKYKAERPSGYPDADLYQMLAYCTALGLAAGHLVYALGSAPHAVHRVRHAGVRIHQHTLDLRLPPAALLARVDAVARLLGAR